MAQLPTYPSEAFRQTVMSVVLLTGTIRRFHDVGLTGWWVVGLMLMSLVVYAGASNWLTPPYAEYAAGWVLVATQALLCAWPGQAHENRFGPPPAWRRRLNDAFG